MLLFYIRHGDPLYNPDQLTPLGLKQAEALAKRLALFGIDRIYSSDSVRAMQTAQPTCDLVLKKKKLIPAFHEDLVYFDTLIYDEKGERTWPWGHSEMRRLLLSREVRELGERWFEHPEIMKLRDFRPALERIGRATDDWLASLGYHHDRETGTYTVTAENPDERIALFAHEGVGKLLMSHILDIPLPLYAMNFEMQHTGMTVIEFKTWKDGVTNARVLTLSNDSHLYRDGLPLYHRRQIRY